MTGIPPTPKGSGILIMGWNWRQPIASADGPMFSSGTDTVPGMSRFRSVKVVVSPVFAMILTRRRSAASLVPFWRLR
ncbi:hypothetical protein D3C72_2058520 [compost metagenome]